MDQTPTWEFAVFAWYGNGPKDFRAVTFSHRDQIVLDVNAYGSTRQWLGNAGFELVSHQMAPISYLIQKTNFGEFKGYPTVS